MRGDAFDDYSIDGSANVSFSFLAMPWYNIRLVQIVIEVMVDRLRVVVFHAQQKMDLIKSAAVGVQKRLHQDRHDAFSDTLAWADMS